MEQFVFQEENSGQTPAGLGLSCSQKTLKAVVERFREDGLALVCLPLSQGFKPASDCMGSLSQERGCIQYDIERAFIL